MQNPFIQTTRLTKISKPFAAIKGKRAGYIQLAESKEALHYEDLSDSLFLIAKQWCSKLEKLRAKRVYWIILSEQVKQIHIHLYPRWSDEEIKGIDLFALRESDPQPAWNEDLNLLLSEWAEKNLVEII